MSNALSEEKKQQVIALGKLGWSLRKIERETGVRRETAGAYLRAAGIAVRIPRAWGRRAPAKPANEVTPDPSKPAIQVIPDSGAKPANEVTPDFVGHLSQKPSAPTGRVSACRPYRDLIEEQLSRGRNAKAIWQDLVTDHGYPGDYQTVKRFVRRLDGCKLPQAAGIILTEPGEEAQVDYGSGPLVRDPQTGKYRRTRLFVLTLGYSRKSVRLLVWRSSTRIWAELHEKALRRLGGCPRVVVLDNLKEGVLVPDVYDPTINPLFRDVLAHYGVVALPCRIQDPDRKGKVESGVGHAKKTPLKGMRFESLEEAQAYLDRWEERWADTRIHGTTKRQVAAMFAEEKPHLLPCLWNRSAITNTENAWCIWMVAWKWRPPTTACRRDGSGDWSKCNGMSCTCASCIRTPANFFVSICARNVAAIASRKKTTPRKCRSAQRNCCVAPNMREPPSASSAS